MARATALAPTPKLSSRPTASSGTGAANAATVDTGALVGKFIAPTGNDTTGAGTEASPWKSLNKLYANLVAGDTGYCRGGSYTGSNLNVGIIVTSTGTAGSPIIVQPYPGETPVFDGTGATITTQNYAIDFRAGAAYHELRGLTFQDWAWWPARGGNGSKIIGLSAFGGGAGDVHHITWADNTLISGIATPADQDHCFYLGPGGEFITITGNHVVGQASGGGLQGFGCGVVTFADPDPESRSVTIDHNIIRTCQHGVQIWSDVASGGTVFDILHNTLNNCRNMIYVEHGDSVTVRNNAMGTINNSGVLRGPAGQTPNWVADTNFTAQAFEADWSLSAGASGINACTHGNDVGWEGA